MSEPNWDEVRGALKATYDDRYDKDLGMLFCGSDGYDCDAEEVLNKLGFPVITDPDTLEYIGASRNQYDRAFAMMMAAHLTMFIQRWKGYGGTLDGEFRYIPKQQEGQ